jgi:hypothetical protein
VTVTPLAEAEAEETLLAAEMAGEITVEFAEGWADGSWDVPLAATVELRSKPRSRSLDLLVRETSGHIAVVTVIFVLIRVILTVVLLAFTRSTGSRARDNSLRRRSRG